MPVILSFFQCKKYEPDLIEALKKAISGGDLPEVACKAVRLCAAGLFLFI